MVSAKLISRICEFMSTAIEQSESKLLQLVIDSCKEEFLLMKELKTEMDTQLRVYMVMVFKIPMDLSVGYFLEVSNICCDYHIKSEKFAVELDNMIKSFDTSSASICAAMELEQEVMKLKESISKHTEYILQKQVEADKVNVAVATVPATA